MAIKLMNQGVQAQNTSLQQLSHNTEQSTLPLLCLLLILFGFTTSGFPLADAEFGTCLKSFFRTGFCSELYRDDFRLASSCGI